MREILKDAGAMILLILVMLLQAVLWVVTLVRRISCFVFDILAGIIFVTALLCLGFGLETEVVVLRMIFGSLLIYFIPRSFGLVEYTIYLICKNFVILLHGKAD